MNRRALIISPLDYKPLPGMEADVKNYSSFLRSDYGGAWEEDEIKILRHPTHSKLIEWVQYLGRFEFSLITFSGHGDHVSRGPWLSGTTRLWFAENDSILVSELFSQCPRQMVIIDACRNWEEAERIAKSFGELRASLKESADDSYRRSCRALYDTEISRAEEGRTLMYSCSINQSAGEFEDGSGGLFSKSLVTEATVWANTSRHFRALSSQDATSLSVFNCQRAFENATKKIPPPQKPVLIPERRQHYFPFAVAPKSPS